MTAAAALLRPVLRERIERLEAEIATLPAIDYELEHTFGSGFYARTVKLKRDSVLTGLVHRTEHIFFVSKGDITLVTDDGRQRVGAGFQAVCRPGMKRAGYCHADTWVTNVHITTETDLARLEAMLVESMQVRLSEDSACLG